MPGAQRAKHTRDYCWTVEPKRKQMLLGMESYYFSSSVLEVIKEATRQETDKQNMTTWSTWPDRWGTLEDPICAGNLTKGQRPRGNAYLWWTKGWGRKGRWEGNWLQSLKAEEKRRLPHWFEISLWYLLILLCNNTILIIIYTNIA